MDPYEKIAPFYDCEHADFRDDIDFYLNVLPDGPVLEVGSGTGRVTEALARAGYTVCGVDPSDAMLSIARVRVGRFTQVELLQTSIEDVDIVARFHSAVLPLNTLWHFLDVEAQLAALHAVRRALVPEAIVVVDLSNPLTMADRGARGEVRQRFHGECSDGPLTVWSTGWDDEAEQVLELDLLYDQLDAEGRIRRTNVRLELRYLYRYELELLLLHTGFHVRQIYGSYDLDPYTADSPNLIALAQKAQNL